MVTDYGKILRTIRIQEGELLGDMADRLKISSAYLSSIETGSRNVPADLTDEIINTYKLNKGTEKKLRKAEISNMKEIKLTFGDGSYSIKKETAYLFARTFNNIDSNDFAKIRDILLKKEDKSDNV